MKRLTVATTILILFSTGCPYALAGEKDHDHDSIQHEEHDANEKQRHDSLLDIHEEDEHKHENSNEHDHDDRNDHEDDAAHGQLDETGHAGHDGHAEEHQDDGVALNESQLVLANIQVTTLQARKIDYDYYAPAEIKTNGYTSYIVSPRVDSIVLTRHATLGEHIEVGQPLVTLFSERVAEAQATFRTAQAEWFRVKKLGRKSVGEKRYVTAKTEYDVSFGRLKIFGLSDKLIQSLSRNKDNKLGEYTLTAETAGSILSDDFHQGQSVAAGESLMIVADEHTLWAEARLPSNKNLKIGSGNPAKIKIDGEAFDAYVTQEAHTIDPQTRTRVVRLSVDNSAHRLHPGMFADVYFQFITDSPVLAVPETALIRGADGDWTVFVEDHPGEFMAVEVNRGQSFGEWQEISGIAEGSKIVTEGAFFVASQKAKGGFDPHNH